MIDTSTGQLGIFTKAGELVTLTNYFIKAGELVVLANYFGQEQTYGKNERTFDIDRQRV